jgi:hypothetical protein
MTEANWYDYANRKARRGFGNRKSFLLNELRIVQSDITHLTIRYVAADMPAAIKSELDTLRDKRANMMAELESITYPKTES